jgi:hypothetical protein
VLEEFLSTTVVADGQTVNLALLQQEIKEELESKNSQQKEELTRLEVEMRKKNEEIASLYSRLDDKIQSR